MTATKRTVLRKANGADRSKRCRGTIAFAAAAAVFLAAPNAALAMDFPEALKRVDHALRTNPSNVSQFALDSCFKRRNFAVQLYESRQIERAERSLHFCFDALEIPEVAPEAKEKALDVDKLKAKALKEAEEALKLTANVKDGLEVYRECAKCHKPEGWGLTNGSVPQLAGQHSNVIIKQLMDIRAGSRGNPMMEPFACAEAVSSAQSVADVAGYIDTLEISTANGKGPGINLERGERLYQENCASCHGARGEGDPLKYAPRLQSQHYKYLVNQFRWIRDDKRHNADPAMMALIKDMKTTEAKAMLDYVSRLEPPEELQAPEGWQNPDFAGSRPK
ncbi:MAG: cytochrome c [Deltaproteobacteria bacterium]|jgi:cytochrome c553|nr:cytochrome c [Deltaproteobacteria bacterium]